MHKIYIITKKGNHGDKNIGTAAEDREDDECDGEGKGNRLRHGTQNE